MLKKKPKTTVMFLIAIDHGGTHIQQTLLLLNIAIVYMKNVATSSVVTYSHVTVTISSIISDF
jgi:hypothetical protein